MNRKAAEIHAIAACNAWEAEPSFIALSREVQLVDGLLKIMEVKRCELARFIATFIERDARYAVALAPNDFQLMMLFTEPWLKEEFDVALAEADKGGAAGWTYRRLEAIKSIFPIVDGVPSNDYLPPRRPSSGVLRGRAKRWHAKNIGGTT
jgi:hypothetical protein